MKYHMLAFFVGFVADLIVGDPARLPHPVRLIGWWIGWLDHKLFAEERHVEGKERSELLRGSLLVVLVLLPSVALPALILAVAYGCFPWLGVLAEAVMTWQLLAARCLGVESRKVYQRLKENDIRGARRAVSMIVGRDTDSLDGAAVARAAIETVAENTADGVVAPMAFLAIAGPVGGFFYKAVNTMDSMVGYKNERYLYFGRTAAKCDDVCNYIPARMAAAFLIVAAFLGGRAYSGRGAVRIFLRDRYQHASPNSAQTESVMAGALGIRLAGDASYFGKTVKKPWLGDPLREVEAYDIIRAGRLLYLTDCLSELFWLCVMLACIWIR